MWIATLILLRCCRELPTKVLFKRRADFQIFRIRDLDSGQILDLRVPSDASICLLAHAGREAPRARGKNLEEKRFRHSRAGFLN